ncbi:HAMP domain-containing histidine kinase [Paraconexibacter antarcticus]|uniref:histidine kinase n=1 Tax=Paraconexibacter antarcticus TaxID=2949664 RepID=A0ABY5DV87_9ACTN|nr:HAMP domain-containing sensor histidine kinase [Paraconexibacter antarcticus]UTI65479.1 HAMP domain-containing histidine kinase [Paraconexibacter antarcticus]
MSFRRRIALLTGAAVAVSILLASTLAYVTVRGQLLGQVDSSLRGRASQFVSFVRRPLLPPPAAAVGVTGGTATPSLRAGGGSPGFGVARSRLFVRPPQRRGDIDFYDQFLTAAGTRATGPPGRGSDRLPVDGTARAIARRGAGAELRVARVGGTRVRLLTTGLPGGGAVQLGRPLKEVDTTLAHIRWLLLIVALGGIALAVVLGRIVAARAMRPLARLTETAEHVAATQDLGRRIEAPGGDEIGRLATSFNEMLDTLQVSMRALDASVHAQRQLIADASHELRTPVTSLRTNIEVLGANPDLSPELRATLVERATHQAEELTLLMNGLIDLARGEGPEGAPSTLSLDELVAGAVARARRHAPGQAFVVELEPTLVVGSHDRLARAVNNVLDNAVAWNAPGAPIAVTLAGGTLVVRDHGPGFAAGEVGQVLDRFFRGAGARDRAGSGLGLAIARQAVTAHGGAVTVANAPDGGAVVRFELAAAGVAAARVAAAREPEAAPGPAADLLRA